MAKNLGQLGDTYFRKIEEISKANAKVKILEDEKHGIEAELMAKMDEESTDIVRGELATISKVESVVPQIEDYDKFMQWVLRHKALHMLERRVSAVAYREVRDSTKKAVPGLLDYVKVRLNYKRL